MADTIAVYSIGDELGDLSLYWTDTNGDLINFVSGYTFSVQVYNAAGTSQFTAKTTNITGAAGSLTTPTPNVVVAWATSNELSSIATAGLYNFRCVATRTADSKTRTFRGQIRLLAQAT